MIVILIICFPNSGITIFSEDSRKIERIRDDSRLRVYAYFYYMAVGAGLNSDLAAVFVSSRLS